jgi:subtilase-type serine protease
VNSHLRPAVVAQGAKKNVQHLVLGKFKREMMSKNTFRLLPLAAAVLTACYQPISHAQSTNDSNGGGNSTPYEIPLGIQPIENPNAVPKPSNPFWVALNPANPYPDKTTTQVVLSITLGLNGGTPETLVFDTGSTADVIDAGPNYLHDSWLPLAKGQQVVPQPGFALYGDGTYGAQVATTAMPSVQFYKPGEKTPITTFAPPQGTEVSLNMMWIATGESLTNGPSGKPGQIMGIADDGTPLYQDLTWLDNVNQGQPSGIFGAGPFGSDSILGQMTTSGYVVAANSEPGARNGVAVNCDSCAHVIMNLNPAIRAQFNTIVPWYGGASGTFPTSGAPVQANQFGELFTYVINGRGPGVTLPTLLDSGTPAMGLIYDDAMLDNATHAGLIDPNAIQLDSGNGTAQGNVIPKTSLTMTGNTKGAQSTTMSTVSPYYGNASQMLTIKSQFDPTNVDWPDPVMLSGVQFFLINSVMYDLANESTGYTPFFVSVDPIATGKSGYTLINKMAPQGIAGVISGAGPFAIGSGASAQLSNINTYTGATLIGKEGWLGLAGPGSIASSSGVQADGTFDISRVDPTAYITSLSGAGNVALGANTLELTNASGTFNGQLTDGGLGGGVGGSVILAGGRETLSGLNTYTGSTGIGPRGILVLNGSLAGPVLDAGVLSGQGSMDGLAVTGIVAPGQGMGSYQTLTVNGSYHQQAGSSYVAQINAADASSRIAVRGKAALDPGANLHVLAAATPATLYTKGTQYTLLSATSGVNGRYTSLTLPSLSAVLGLAPTYDADNVYLDVVQTRLLNTLGGTPNQVATLSGVQSLPASNTVFGTLINLPSDKAIRAAASQLSGEVHASTQAAFLDDSRFLRDATTSRLRQATQDGQVNPSSEGLAVQNHTNGSAVWGQFLGSWDRLDSDGNASQLTDTVGGFLIGADTLIGDHARAGVVTGYSQTSFLSPLSMRSGSHDGYLGVYAGGQWDGWNVDGGLGITQHLLATNRSVRVPGLTGATWDRSKAYTRQAFGEVGYDFVFRATTVEPFAQAAYVQLQSNGYQEQGSVAALRGVGDRHDATYGTLGAHVDTTFPFNGDLFTAFGTLGWRHASGYVNPSTTQAFAGGADFTVAGVPIAANAAVITTGLQVQVLKNTTLNVSYNGQIARHAVDSGFSGGVTWHF